MKCFCPKKEKITATISKLNVLYLSGELHYKLGNYQKAYQSQEEMFNFAVTLPEKNNIEEGLNTSKYQNSKQNFDSPSIRSMFIKQLKFEFIQAFKNKYFILFFPFKNIFNSGSVLLSLSFQTPAITPFTENFDEYNKYIPGMIHQYKSSLDEKMNNEFSVKYSGEVADELKWQNIANSTVSLYSKLLDKH